MRSPSGWAALASAVSRLSALVALLGWLGGLPVFLLRWGGWPLDDAPGWDRFRDLPVPSAADALIVGTVSILAWGVWGQLAGGVVAEARHHVRGGGPGVLSDEPVRRFAQDLVGLVVVLPETGADTAAVSERVVYETVRSVLKLVGGQSSPSSGRHFILPERVVTDYGIFCDLVAQATRVDQPDLATTLLGEALDLVRGEPFTGVSRSYGWAAPQRAEMVVRVIDVAEELAESCLARGDWEAAEGAARRGLRASPTDERLYRPFETDGEVIENAIFDCGVEIYASGVTIRNSLIRGGDDFGIYVVPGNGDPAIIEDVTIESASGCSPAGIGLGQGSYHATRVEAVSFGQAFLFAGRDTVVQDSYAKPCAPAGTQFGGVPFVNGVFLSSLLTPDRFVIGPG